MSKIAAAFGAIAFGAVGLWAFLSPRSFYDVIAPYAPYNQHFVHDLGAFQLGLAAVLIAGLLLRDALLAVLAGATVGAAAHLVSHIEDQSLGGRASDPYMVAAVAVVLLIGTILRWREGRG